ncbi:MAG TPA: hypothetical protein VHG91_14455, partial [Longimicrobium sp.]|nr:hypothetical protein [Longimicrobium sp.]
AREGDDPVYLFAVCLDTLLPKPSGWRSSLPVLSRICTTPTGELLASRVLLPAAPLWGVSPDERLVPPGCLDVLRHLSVAASTIHPEFGDAFADGFQPASPFPGLSRASVDGWGFPAELAGGDGVGAEAAPDAVRALLEGADPLTTATVLELALGGAPPDARQLRRVRETAAALLDTSPIDAVLFLARMASAFPGHGFADGWLEDALRETGRLPAEEVRAEVLARLRGRVAHDPALRKLHARLAREIGSPVLRAHAEGRLGRFLASPAFAWNAPELLGGDPAWTVAAVHAALSEAARHAGAAEDPDLLWAELARTPGAETLERLLEAAAERGLLCSPAAAAAVDALRALPSEARRELLPERVYPHLQRPTGSTLRHLGRWLEGAGSGEAEDALLAGQAAVLLAESTRDLRPEWVGPLFTAVERGDDYQAWRAELALAGPWRHIERESRRFRTSLQGVPALRALADRLHASYGSAGDGALAHVAICAINDWWVDAPEPLARWCAEADASPAAEGALLAAVHACDLWSPECQRTVAEWLCAEGVEEARRDRRRGMMLAWVARQHFHKHALPEPALLERLEGAALSALREVRTLPCIGKDLVHHALVADACAAAAEAAVGKSAAARAAEHLDGRLVPVFGPDGKLDPEALATLGQSYYSWIGQWPEVAFPHVRVHLDNPSFRRVLADWLRSTLDEWMQARAGDDTPVSRILLTRLDALLGFAVCLSGHNEAAFTRLCEPEDFLAPLAAVCLWQPSALAHMSAVTLISRMRRVDLDLPVDDGDGRAPTVLDALLAGLRGRTEVQERLAVALPGIVEFQGVRVVDRLRSILTGDSPEGERTPLASGSEVMAAADLLAKMLRRGTLRDPAVRRRALDALREATASPRNRRPLFRKLGYGNEGDPVGMVRVGSLAHELMGVVARL